MDTFASTTGTTRSTLSAPDRLHTALNLLKYTYGLVPIVAGLDKFTHLLTDWNKYLAPAVADMLPFQPATFMHLVGVIEIIAGILVLIKPKIGSLVVSLWLLGIALNLLLSGQYYDIAVRDIVMAIGAFSLHLLVKAQTER
ncbi:MAG: tRNA (5-methylaminomethyl-2-thiouridylate)-methyltransferase [Bacteroidota bacterium]|nr:tRNA (5-methylaminomethyl-2-thiouridylate)-methyltransferase [Bacteroidota bacterium]